MIQLTRNDIIRRHAADVLSRQMDTGSFPSTLDDEYIASGPPVRSTTSWLLILLKAYTLNSEPKFKRAANRAADYLLSNEARPYQKTLHSRNVDGKDKCDGLVGQASPIQALHRAGDVLNRAELSDKAREIFFLHPFDDNIGLWRPVEITGDVLLFDRTLNHQAKFAAAGVELQNERASQRVDCFLSRLNPNFHIYKSGLIKDYPFPPLRHLLERPYDPAYRNLIRGWLTSHIKSHSGLSREKEIGYHPHNMRHFSQLYLSCTSHQFWETSEFCAAFDYMLDDIAKQRAKTVESGSNIPGLYYGVALTNFQGYDERISKRLIQDTVSAAIRDCYGSKVTESGNVPPGVLRTMIDLPDLPIQVYDD